MLALDLVEIGRRAVVVAPLEMFEAFIVEHLDRLLDIFKLGFGRAAAGRGQHENGGE